MLTLAALTRQPEYLLHPLHTAGPEDRVVDRAELLMPGERPARLAGTLLICSPDTVDIGHAHDWLRHWADQGAAGLVLVAEAAPRPPRPLLEAARHAALPLLASGAPVAAWRRTLIPQVAEHRRQEADRHAARLAHLLDYLDSDSSPAGDLLDWLARQLDAEVSLQRDSRISVPPSGRRLSAADSTFTSVHSLRDDDLLLTAHRHHPFSTADQDLLARSAMVLTTRRRTSVPAGGTLLAETLHAVHLAAFQALMTGHIESAQRILGPLLPYLLDTDDVQIAIVNCADTSRDEVLARVETLLSDTGLAARCPAFDGHIVVVAPHRDPGLPEAPAVTALRRLVADRSRRLSLGISPSLPLQDTATGFALAYDAIAAARLSPTRAAVAPLTPGLLDALDLPAAQQWATVLLQPVLSHQLSTVALGLEFEVSAASRILGIHRNTLSRRIHTVLRATGLATDRTADRITLSLALQIHALHGPATDPAPHPTPTLAHLLAQPPVTDWAATALAPLGRQRTDQRTTSSDTLARTLRTWAHEDFRVDTTAQRLNLYPATVRGHVRTAEALLGWILLSNVPTGLLPDDKDAPGKQSGLRNLAVALQAGPGTPRTTLPDPTACCVSTSGQGHDKDPQRDTASPATV
ncbi:helix-turn-helix domain-containing protein [Streptomyces sp. NPDC029721]|uniref:helix-turn-helix domain-containing protein n=1 Tax=Streptomyces sp. NPDC029721 TaxID=3157090 RepID=UPI0034072754